MQEQKINQPLYLALQTDYEIVELGLFQGTHQLEVMHCSKTQASKTLIPEIATLLKNNTRTLDELTFVALNQGPGPFTTLRAIITTANGISFSSGKPLVGVNGIEQLLQQNATQGLRTIALLNAFNYDLYYALNNEDGTMQSGCLSIDKIIELVKGSNGEQFVCIGNGAALYQKELLKGLGDNVLIPKPTILHISMQQLAYAALSTWQTEQKHQYQLAPLYLKVQQYSRALSER